MALSTHCAAATAWVSVCCNNPGQVSRYDTATQKSLPSLNSGAPTPVSAIVSPDGSKVYVANEGDNPQNGGPSVVTVLDASSGELLQTITIPEAPFDLAISADGSSLYVVSAAFNPNGGGLIYVHLVDTASSRIVATSASYSDTSAFAGSPAARIQISPDGSKLYLALFSAMAALDSTTLSQLAYSSALNLPVLSFAISPDGAHIYLPQQGSETAAIAILDASDFQVVSTLTLSENFPGPLVLSQDGTMLYQVTSYDPNDNPAGNLSVISIQSDKVIATYSLTRVPNDLAISADGSTVYGNVPFQSSPRHWL